MVPECVFLKRLQEFQKVMNMVLIMTGTGKISSHLNVPFLECGHYWAWNSKYTFKFGTKLSRRGWMELDLSEGVIHHLLSINS